ncbi:MAG: hypothetical protein V1712_02940 [Patescibacteria group bacterium]
MIKNSSQPNSVTNQPPANKTLFIILLVLIILAIVILAIFTIHFNIKKIDENKDTKSELFGPIINKLNQSFSANNNSAINN